jgi:hypothetical protein
MAPHDPAVLRAARGGLDAFGALWIALGAAIAIGALDIGISDPTSAAVVGALLGADGAAFVLAAGLFRRRGAWLDVAVAALVAVNLLLTTTDQVGLLDLAALVLLGGLLVLIAIGIRGGRPA